jgi:O-antigen/teichoic acid export membrane protein
MTARRALLFSFLDRYAALVMNIVSSMVIARLLTPAELGVFSVVMVLTTFVAAMRDMGAGQYLLQEKELTPTRLRATWTVQLGMGWLMAVVVLAAAFPAARFYDEPAMVGVMLVLSLNFATNPVGAMSYAWLMREMRFDVLAGIRLASATTGALVSVTLAWLDYGAISLAFGSLAATVVNGLAGLRFRPAGLGWGVGLAEVRRVLGFGSKISATGLLGSLANGAPELFLGKLQGVQAAGLYSRGNGLAFMFHRLVLDATCAVALPLFAQAQREQGTGVQPWLRAVCYVTALGWTFFGSVALLAYPLTRLLYGDQWDASVPITRWICLALALGLPAALTPHLLIGTGLATRLLKLTGVVLMTQVICVAAGAHFGLTQAAMGYAVAQCLGMLIWLRGTHVELGFKWRDLAQAIGRSAAVAGLTLLIPAACVAAFGLTPAQPVPPLLCAVVLGLPWFVLSLRWLGHPLYAEVQGLAGRVPGLKRWAFR